MLLEITLIDHLKDWWWVWLIVIVIFVLFSIPFTLLYQQSKSPTFSLYKHEWTCAETSTYWTNQTMLVGKVIVNQPTRQVQCDVYVRINK